MTRNLTSESKRLDSKQAASDESIVWLNAEKGPDGLPIPVISVVVVSYFTGASLDNCIQSVLDQKFPVELIIVDNGNPVEVSEELETLAKSNKQIALRSGHGNIGFARACNLGAKVARGHFLLFLNPDAELPEEALEQLYAESLQLPRPWLMGAKLINTDGSEQRGGRRDILTPWSAFVEGLKIYALAPQHPRFSRFNRNESHCPEDITPTPVISGACMMVPREDYWAIGGFDEGYFLHVEDIDFCYRFRFAGGQAYFVPTVAVTHNKSSSRATVLFVEWCKAKGFMRYFWKNFRPFYPGPFLLAVNTGIFVYYCAKSIRLGFNALLSPFKRFFKRSAKEQLPKG